MQSFVGFCYQICGRLWVSCCSCGSGWLGVFKPVPRTYAKVCAFTVNMYSSNEIFQPTRAPLLATLLLNNISRNWRYGLNVKVTRDQWSCLFTSNVCFVFPPLAFLLLLRHSHFCSAPRNQQMHCASLCCKFHSACVRESVRETAGGEC